MEQSEAPTASPNRQACEGRTREGNGGVGSAQAYHMEGWKWERERGGVPGMAVGSTGQRTWPTMAPDRRAQAAMLLRGQEGATGLGDATLHD
jgi:hypothetical protein